MPQIRESFGFAVADVADAPFADSCFDVVMSVLSPWNYKECSRLLRKGGTVIKAVPRRDYLKEVREFFFGDSPRRNDTADSADDSKRAFKPLSANGCVTRRP